MRFSSQFGLILLPTLIVGALRPESALASRAGVMEFPNARFEYLGVLDEGNSTTILDLGVREAVREAVRVAKKNENFNLNSNLLYQFAMAYPVLKKYGAPIPTVYEIGGLNHDLEIADYVRLQKVRVVISLENWLNNFEASSVTKKQIEGLKKFARDLKAFSILGDFAPRQVVWTGHRWVLLDWFGGQQLATPNSISPFMIWLLQANTFRSRTRRLI